MIQSVQKMFWHDLGRHAVNGFMVEKTGIISSGFEPEIFRVPSEIFVPRKLKYIDCTQVQTSG